MLLKAIAGMALLVAMGTGPLHLVDTSHVPTVSLSWTTGEGREIDLEVQRPYASKYDRTHMAGNVDCFVAVGGTRIDKGCGHPDGLVIRVGFYKRDNGELFFEGIESDGSLTIELANVLANQPDRPIPHTVIQHLQYTREDIEACGIGREGQDQFNTLHPEENLLGQLTEANTRFGALGGDMSDTGGTGDTGEGADEADGQPRGEVEFTREEDGTLTMRAVVPYAILRHLQDPWVRTEPGLFLEPYHFHIEFELLPDGVEARPLARPAPAQAAQ